MRLGDLDALEAEFDSIANKSAIGEWQSIPIKHIKQIINNAETYNQVGHRMATAEGFITNPEWIKGEDYMDEDAKQASIPYTYKAPQHDWKCGYPDITRDEGESKNE